MPITRTNASMLRVATFVVLAFTVLLPVCSFAQGEAPSSAAPQVTLLDPVPSLLKGSAVTTNVNVLASKGRMVEGTAADSAS